MTTKKLQASPAITDAKAVQPASPSAWERWVANVKTIGGAILVAMVIRVVIFEAFEIEGPSMRPTLFNGDRVVVAKFMYGLFLPFADQAIVNWKTPRLGDVVIVKSPADNIDIVKRVVGLPGDAIELRRDGIVRNGKPLPRQHLGFCPSDTHPEQKLRDCEWFRESDGGRSHLTSFTCDRDPYGEAMQARRCERLTYSAASVRVPAGHVFVMGDHRNKSNDSRFFGPVPIRRVKGRSLLIYWSSDEDGVRWRRLAEPVR